MRGARVGGSELGVWSSEFQFEGEQDFRISRRKVSGTTRKNARQNQRLTRKNHALKVSTRSLRVRKL
jgi:hypothetical protein